MGIHCGTPDKICQIHSQEGQNNTLVISVPVVCGSPVAEEDKASQEPELHTITSSSNLLMLKQFVSSILEAGHGGKITVLSDCFIW